jgi:short-subunit dehydrogenase
MDITNDESTVQGIQNLEKETQIDVLVNNTGYGSFGASKRFNHRGKISVLG